MEPTYIAYTRFFNFVWELSTLLPLTALLSLYWPHLESLGMCVILGILAAEDQLIHVFALFSENP